MGLPKNWKPPYRVFRVEGFGVLKHEGFRCFAGEVLGLRAAVLGAGEWYRGQGLLPTPWETCKVAA